MADSIKTQYINSEVQWRTGIARVCLSMVGRAKEKIKYKFHKGANTDDQNFLMYISPLILYLSGKSAYPAIYNNYKKV